MDIIIPTTYNKLETVDLKLRRKPTCGCLVLSCDVYATIPCTEKASNSHVPPRTPGITKQNVIMIDSFLIYKS